MRKTRQSTLRQARGSPSKVSAPYNSHTPSPLSPTPICNSPPLRYEEEEELADSGSEYQPEPSSQETSSQDVSSQAIRYIRLSPVLAPAPPRQPSSPTEEEKPDEKKPKVHTPRPSNSFILYRQAFKIAWDLEKGRTKQCDLSKYAGKGWRTEEDSVRAYFVALAAHIAREHRRKFPDYKYKPGQKKEYKQQTNAKRSQARKQRIPQQKKKDATVSASARLKAEVTGATTVAKAKTARKRRTQRKDSPGPNVGAVDPPSRVPSTLPVPPLMHPNMVPAPHPATGVQAYVSMSANPGGPYLQQMPDPRMSRVHTPAPHMSRVNTPAPAAPVASGSGARAAGMQMPMYMPDPNMHLIHNPAPAVPVASGSRTRTTEMHPSMYTHGGQALNEAYFYPVTSVYQDGASNANANLPEINFGFTNGDNNNLGNGHEDLSGTFTDFLGVGDGDQQLYTGHAWELPEGLREPPSVFEMEQMFLHFGDQQ